jgi:hypothetical protein
VCGGKKVEVGTDENAHASAGVVADVVEVADLLALDVVHGEGALDGRVPHEEVALAAGLHQQPLRRLPALLAVEPPFRASPITQHRQVPLPCHAHVTQAPTLKQRREREREKTHFFPF